ncbi:MAG TPA: hypothetical protein VFU41_02740 [Gemmatimonadales bacterium]|nr:hypothetical protein [Gemmatimonadales bacterium]
MQKERDWDKEMAEVDRLLKKLPSAEPTPSRGAEPTVRRPAVSGGPVAIAETMFRSSAREWLGTWAKVGLGVLVGIGLTPGVWPYSHGCGLRLIFYLLGVTTVIAAGVWAGLSSWKRRLGIAHVVSQVLIVWGTLLLAREVLPRLGADAAAQWLCPDVPPSR